MPHIVRLDNYGNYGKDIKKLRKIGRVRGNNDTVTLSHGGNTVVLHINTLNYYLIGFNGPAHTYYFDGVAANAHYGIGGAVRQMQVGENYNDIGLNGGGGYPSIPPATVIARLSAYNPAAAIAAGPAAGRYPVDAAMRVALCTAIFLVCEATRFDTVLATMTECVKNSATTNMDALRGTVTNWSNGTAEGISVPHHG